MKTKENHILLKVLKIIGKSINVFFGFHWFSFVFSIGTKCILFFLFFSTAYAQQYFPVRDRAEVKCLDGTWDFTLEGESASRSLQVPGNWELQGVKTPDYGSDLKEVKGTYHRTFMYDAYWEGRDVILRFDGVQNGFTAYINGHEVGSGHSGHTMHQFNITPYLIKGKNDITIKVSSHSDYWLFDVCDAWSYTGIQHSVQLFSVPREANIADISFVSKINADNSADITIGTKVNATSSKDTYLVKASLIDEKYNHVIDLQGNTSNGESLLTSNGLSHGANGTRLKLWTAETPNLYTLRVSLYKKGGDRPLQTIEQQVGLREIKVENCQVLLNNRPIFLKGVCLSENDAIEGSAISPATFRRILLQMKAANINFIRTAHYPLNPAFNSLCDQLGFYVCEEIPFASRGGEMLKTNSPEVIAELKSRAKATIDRDRNHPSIILWTHGNENKIYSCQDSVLKFTKEYDPTRLRGVPQAKGPFQTFIKRPSEYVDVICGHYANDGVLADACKYSTKPIINTEYAHSLGTATGELEHKYEIFRREPKIAGGSIWSYEDQSVLTYNFNQQNQVLKGVRIDSLRYIDNYGLNPVPEDAKEQGKEGTDGIVYGDLYPSEDYFETAQVYTPVQLSMISSAGTASVEVKNLFDFISLQGYQLKYSLLHYNEVLSEGAKYLTAKSGQTEKFDIPVNSNDKDLILSFEVLRPDRSTCYTKSYRVGEQTDYASWAMDGSRVMSQDSRVKGSSVSKFLSSLISDIRLRVGRQISIGLDYRRKGLWNPYMLSASNVKIKKQKGGYRMTCRWTNPGEGKDSSYFKGVLDINVCKNGALDISYTITPSDSVSGKTLDFGLTIALPAEYEDVQWFGEGPFSHTPDKTAYNNPGLWQLNKDDLRFWGNRGDVSFLTASGNGKSISFVSDTRNLFLENIDGHINITDNVNVSTYGTKFHGPETKSIKAVSCVKGHIIVAPGTPADFTLAIPENPYLDSYGK